MKLTKLLLILLLISGEAMAGDYFDKCEILREGSISQSGIYRCRDAESVCTYSRVNSGYSVSCFPINTKAK